MPEAAVFEARAVKSRVSRKPPSTEDKNMMRTIKKAKGGKLGDPSKLSAEKFSARAKRATLRGDESGTYMKGGPIKKAQGGKC